MNKLRIVFLIVACLTIAFSCKNPKKQDSKGFKFEREVKSDIEAKKSMIYLFPSPGELLDRFYEANLPFKKELLHDPNMADNYMTSKEQGLNLGVYITDMAYTALFSRSSEATDYLKVVNTLSSELNISLTDFESLAERAKNNIGVRDSMIIISNELFFNMLEFLEYSDMENTVAVISSGAYIESIYITLNSIGDYKKEDPLLQAIAELKYPVQNLLSQAESVSDDPNVQSIIKYVKAINDMFSELATETSKATKTEPGVISFTGGSAPELSLENFNQMKSTISEIREYIIEN